MLWDYFYRTLCLCVAMNYSTPICVVRERSSRKKAGAAFYFQNEKPQDTCCLFFLYIYIYDMSLKNYTSDCQVFVLGGLLNFTTEFKRRSLLPPPCTHSFTCVLKHFSGGCRLPASSFLVKHCKRRTTKKVGDKNCQRTAAVARIAGACQNTKEPVVSGISALHLSQKSFVKFVIHGWV